MRRTTRPARRLLPLLLCLVLSLAACDDGPSGAAGSAGNPQAAAARTQTADGAEVDVGADGRRLLLRDDGAQRVLAELDPESDGEVVHVAVRPGDHDRETVLVLARVDERFELRYLVFDGQEATDLYWFPWRLQVDEGLAEVADAPPTPVWAPDGSAVAWLEWDEDGVRLRIVGWASDRRGSNPADDARTYRVPDVPIGARLEAWEIDDHLDVLVADDGERKWRIEVGPSGDALTAHGPRGRAGLPV